MCTAATYQTKDFYFGRTLDYEFSYGEEIAVMPRNYPLSFRHVAKKLNSHYAMIGMAHVAGSYPLYYDAVNEKGVGMAGLNFVGNAAYQELTEGKDNIASFEFIPWVLAQCADLSAARALLWARYPSPGPMRRTLAFCRRMRGMLWGEMPPSAPGSQGQRQHSGRRAAAAAATGSTLASVTMPAPVRRAPSTVSAAAPR